MPINQSGIVPNRSAKQSDCAAQHRNANSGTSKSRTVRKTCSSSNSRPNGKILWNVERLVEISRKVGELENTVRHLAPLSPNRRRRRTSSGTPLIYPSLCASQRYGVTGCDRLGSRGTSTVGFGISALSEPGLIPQLSEPPRRDVPRKQAPV